MWELYTFWAFTPAILSFYFSNEGISNDELAFLSFFIIAIGSIGSVVGGYLANKWSSEKVSSAFLFGSFICCLLSPFIFQLSLPLFLLFLSTWSILVVGDSPQFSTLVANHAKAENKGSSLTIVNGIGFSITIISLMLVGKIQSFLSVNYLFLFLSLGPLLGLLAMYNAFFKRENQH